MVAPRSTTCCGLLPDTTRMAHFMEENRFSLAWLYCGCWWSAVTAALSRPCKTLLPLLSTRATVVAPADWSCFSLFGEAWPLFLSLAFCSLLLGEGGGRKDSRTQRGAHFRQFWRNDEKCAEAFSRIPKEW